MRNMELSGNFHYSLFAVLNGQSFALFKMAIRNMTKSMFVRLIFYLGYRHACSSKYFIKLLADLDMIISF